METYLPSELRERIEKYPKFEDGRIDYTSERVCPVVNCVIVCGDKVLLTERGADLIAYPNTWNGVSGFIDTLEALEDIVRNELTEELGVNLDDVEEMRILSELVQIDESINREWRVYPVLIRVSEQFSPVVNWENKSAHWLTVNEVRQQDLLPGFEPVLDAVLGEISA